MHMKCVHNEYHYDTLQLSLEIFLCNLAITMYGRNETNLFLCSVKSVGILHNNSQLSAVK